MRRLYVRPLVAAAAVAVAGVGITLTHLPAAHGQGVGGNAPPGNAAKKPTQPVKSATPVTKPVIKNVAPKTVVQTKPPVQVPKKIVTPSTSAPALKKALPANVPTKTTLPTNKTVTPGTGGTPLAKVPVKKIDPNTLPKTTTKSGTTPGTPIGKTIVTPGTPPIKTLPPNLAKVPLTPPVGTGTPTPLKLNPGAGAPVLPKTGAPILKLPNKPPILAAPGLKLPPLKPVAKLPSPIFFPPPKLPPLPPPKWAGPQPIPPSFAWHPWKGKNLLPAFFVGAIIGAGAASAGYSYWSPPPPSCYLGGGVVYYYPGTKVCFDFATAVPGDPFMFDDRVYYWEPRRYRTVERLIEVERERAEPVVGWADREPTRLTLVKSGMDRAATRAKSVAAVPIEKLDCSTCLAALGPTEGEGGQCTVSLVNNCDHDVSVSGGLALASAKPDEPPLCDFQGDVPTGAEVAACTRPCAAFTEAQVFLNAVIPVEGTKRPAPACRVPEPREARAQ